jgi:hypothetical protein
VKRLFLSSAIIGVLMGGFSLPVVADGFSFTFEWGNIPSCSDGSPNDVTNPIFTLSNVPTGAKTIDFELIDLDVDYDHEGGTATLSGSNIIQPGAFEYKSPCPPDGSHVYEWTATVKNANGDKIGKATSEKEYP